jgi:flavin reductase (DIM6/NTAB) family NADH-FMN oxidoreductase RutF
MNLKKEFFNITPALLTQLPRGAFLSASAEGKSNTMTIGWGTVGFIWGKPILMVAVRFSRYTYTILEKTDTFTVSVPVSNEFQQLLGRRALCPGGIGQIQRICRSAASQAGQLTDQ